MECALQCQNNFFCTAYRPNQKTYLRPEERAQLGPPDLLGPFPQSTNQNHNIYIDPLKTGKLHNGSWMYTR